MHDEYKAHIRAIIQDTVARTTKDNPNDLTRLMLRDALQHKGLYTDEAEHVASKAHIEVSQSIFDDQVFMADVIEGYAEIIRRNKVYAYQNYTNAKEVFLNLSEGVAITFTPDET